MNANPSLRRHKKHSVQTFDYNSLEPRELLAVGDLGYTGWADGVNSFPHETNSIQTVAELSDAYTSTDGTWSFWWNAPENWPNHTNSDLSSNPVGNPSDYTPLVKDAGANRWTVDGDGDLTNGSPGQYLRVSDSIWHPGLAYSASSTWHDRFAFAAFEVAESGFYRLADLSVGVDAASTDGVTLVVHVEQEFRYSDSFTAGSTMLDQDLGYVAAGDRIFFGFGGNDTFNSDRITPNFRLERVLPREAPFTGHTGLSSSQIEELTINAGSGHLDQINTGIANAVTRQGGNSAVPVKLNITANDSIVLSKSTSVASWIDIDGVQNLEIDFNGAQILVDGVGATLFSQNLITIKESNNILLTNFKLDFTDATLPFTQGVIVHSGQLSGQRPFIDVEIEAGFNPVFVDSSTLHPVFADTSPNTLYYGYPVSADGSGRILENTDVHYRALEKTVSGGPRFEYLASATSDKVRIYVAHLDGLEVGDGFVLQHRGSQSIIGIRGESDQITIDQATVYSAPAVFLTGQNTSNINFLNSEVKAKEGRWKSINAAAVHLQNQRSGGWIENNFIEGGGDDNMIMYTLPYVATEQAVVSGKTRLKMRKVNAYSFGKEDPTVKVLTADIKVGDRIEFYDPINGQRPVIATVTETIPESTGSVFLEWVVFDQVFDYGTTYAGNQNGGQDLRELLSGYNTSHSNGFYVANNEFANSKRHGVLLQAGHGYFVDNVFRGLAGQAIAAHNESAWPLGHWASEVLVQGNEFIDIGFGRDYKDDDFQSAAVGFHPGRLHPTATGYNRVDVFVNSPEYIYENLEIRDNLFYNWRKAAITVRNATDFNVVGNTIVTPEKFADGSSDAGYYQSGDPNQDTDSAAIRVSFSVNGEVSDNYTADTYHLFATDAAFLEAQRTYYNTVNLDEYNHPANSQIPNVTVSNLVAWFRFDRRQYDSRGSAIVDDSSNHPINNSFVFYEGGSQRTNIGGADVDEYSQLGRLDYAANFDGVDDGAIIVYSNNINNQTTAKRTLSMWVNPSTATVSSSDPHMIYEEGTSSRGMNAYVRNGKIFAGIWDGSTEEFLEFDIDSGWQHLSIVLDASGTTGDFKAYLNGFEASRGVGMQLANRGDNVGIGMKSGTTRIKNGGTPERFEGQIDDLRIYNRVLSDNDIAALALQRLSSSWTFPSVEAAVATPPAMPMMLLQPIESSSFEIGRSMASMASPAWLGSAGPMALAGSIRETPGGQQEGKLETGAFDVSVARDSVFASEIDLMDTESASIGETLEPRLNTQWSRV